MRNKWIKRGGLLTMIFCLSLLLTAGCHAAMVTVVYTDENIGNNYLFARDFDSAVQSFTAQVGNEEADPEFLEVTSASEAGGFITHILVDNSNSTLDNNNPEKVAKVKELLNGIIDNSMENEWIRLSTYSTEIHTIVNYSNNKDELHNAVESISANDQYSYLTDALYNTLDELNNDGNFAYKRIIVICDGVNNSDGGNYTIKQIESMNTCHIPIYGVGLKWAQDIQGLDNLQELAMESVGANARSAGTYHELEDVNSEVGEILAAFQRDYSAVRFSVAVPQSALGGQLISYKLNVQTDSGEVSLTAYDIRTPMTLNPVLMEEIIEETPSPEPTPSATPTPTATPTPFPSLTPTPTPAPVEEKEGIPLYVIAIAAGILLLVVILIILLIVTKKKSAAKQYDNQFAGFDGDEGKTQVFDVSGSQSGPMGGPNIPMGGQYRPMSGSNTPMSGPGPDRTSAMYPQQSAPDGSDNEKTMAMFNGSNRQNAPGSVGEVTWIFTDMQNPQRRYSVRVNGLIVLGRNSSQSDFVIPGDKAIGKQHCNLILENGRCFIEDRGSVNGVFVNRNRITARVEVHNGDQIRIGNTELMLELR